MARVFGIKLFTVISTTLMPVPRYESSVRELREKKGLSQEALARELGVSRQTIVNIERGFNEPRVLLAIALAAFLGVLVHELFRKGAPR